ncbi:EF-hand domain-containing protein [Peristeroidobacter soli]|uniref:EF-hand domain-containing protein n=1 Tax=Peristeroidobacter soli TaxID=2497877 RepID=UPI00101D42B7|nr:EF-hand domain-containing protein [Peristeroidobacter soli]
MTSAISMSNCYSSYASTQTRAADTSKLQQQLFSKVDTNGDKSIDATELTSFLDYVGEKTGSSIDSASALKALDSDGNGSISETELTDNASALFDQLKSQLMSSQMQPGHGGPPPPPPSGEDSSDMFSSIDTDGDGSISKTELETFLSSRADDSGKGPSADDILARDDTDGDGAISSAEFEDAMSRGPQGHRGGDSGGMNFEKLLSSLVNQYAAVGSASSAVGSLSVAA